MVKTTIFFQAICSFFESEFQACHPENFPGNLYSVYTVVSPHVSFLFSLTGLPAPATPTKKIRMLICIAEVGTCAFFRAIALIRSSHKRSATASIVKNYIKKEKLKTRNKNSTNSRYQCLSTYNPWTSPRHVNIDKVWLLLSVEVEAKKGGRRVIWLLDWGRDIEANRGLTLR